MHGQEAVEHAAAAIFGMDPFWVATALFAGVYLVIMTGRII